MRSPIHLVGLKHVVSRPGLGALLLSLALVQTKAQVMTDQNSTASVHPANQSGMFSWTVDGGNQLQQQWFWYALGPRGGSTPPASIDTLPLTQDAQPTPNTLNLGYQGNGFLLTIGYTLTGGAPGSGVSDIGESIRIQNQTGNTLPIIFYQYSDFDLNGAPGTDTITLSGPPRGGFNDAFQTHGPISMSETVVTPPANEGEAATEFSTLAKLNNGSAPVVLNNNATASGNVTWAFEWDLNIAPGGTVLISKDKNLQVPEPSALALVGLGILGLALRRGRFSK
ncbi:MAG: hypothetical protein C5B50_04890 [Verrucomicrobia bacterium]|nr:MAG: hypothetical protein C5B50_04890 [Verrucomicrobiota bacterium]